MSVLGDIGMGLMGLSNGLNQGWQRNRQDQLLDLQRQQLERQNRLAEGTLSVEQMKVLQGMREMQQKDALQKAMLSLFTNGTMPQLPGTQPGGPAAPPSALPSSPGNSVPGPLSDLLDYWGNYNGLNDQQKAVLPKIMSAESGGNPWAHNKLNANGTDDFGAMQVNSRNLSMLKPGENIFDPSVNTRIGTEIFANALKQSGGDIPGALGAYNTGRVNPNAPYVARVLGQQPIQLAQNGPATMSDAGGGIAPATPPSWMNDPKKIQGLTVLSAMGYAPAVQALTAMEKARTLGTPEKLDGAQWFKAKYGRDFNPSNPIENKVVKDYNQANSTQSTNVNMPPQETQEKKDYGGLLVKQFEGVLNDATLAQDTLDNISAAKSMDVRTGALEPMKTQAGAILAGFGIDPEKLGLGSVKDIGSAQAFSATMSNAILNKAQNMKGNLSDKDVAFLKSTVAGLQQTPEANKTLLEISARVAQRKVQKADFYQTYRADKGTLDGADKAWRDYIKEQPSLFEGMSLGKPSDINSGPSASGGAVVNDPLGIR